MPHGAPEPDPARANLTFRFLRRVGRGLLRALFVIEAEGLQQIPATGPYVLACNHISWIDPIILMALWPAAPRIHYLAATEYSTEGPWPVPLIVRAVGGVIPVDRESHKGDRQAVIQALRVLRGGGVLGIFPEGRCGTVEGEIQPLKDGAGIFATKTGSPVVVVGISGTLDLCFRRRIRVRVGTVLHPAPGESPAEMLARIASAMRESVPPVNPDQPAHPHMRWLARVF